MWLPLGRRDAAALAVVAACVVMVFWKIALTSQYTFIEAPDIGHQVLPWLQVQSAALHKYPSRPRENARICRRPDGCEMPSLLLATPYGVDAAIGASATGVQENPRLARLRRKSQRCGQRGS